jgi:hypothetical protein
MNDDRLRAAYASLLARRGTGRAGCPGPEEIDALASRRGPEAARLETLDHVMSCSECKRELDLLRSVLRAGTPADRVRPRLLALAATLALAAGAILVWRAASRPAAGPLRGSDNPVVLLGPADGASLAEPPVLVWRPVEGAVGYRVEVLDRTGAIVATGLGPDTLLRLPADALAPADSAYRWRVVAELRTGGSISSNIRRLRVTTP